jgi:hypothetical protein
MKLLNFLVILSELRAGLSKKLPLTIPKAEEVQPKAIKVKAKEKK